MKILKSTSLRSRWILWLKIEQGIINESNEVLDISQCFVDNQ